MPLSPAPLPGTSPLPAPGQLPPGRSALRMGSLIALPLLVALLVAGQFILPTLLFIAPGLQARASGGGGSGAGGQGGQAAFFQGFQFPYSRADSGGGYTTADSLKNMRRQAGDYHMNAVLIPVIADMPRRNEGYIAWRPDAAGNLHTLPDGDYERAIADARQAGLLPIFELQMRQQDSNSRVHPTDPVDDGPYFVGRPWWNEGVGFTYGGEDNRGTKNTGVEEQAFFDNYTEFAVHFAQLSERHHLPYFIFGDGLANVTTDTPATSREKDKNGIVKPPNDTCTGRRDCEWRNVVNALRGKTYTPYGDDKPKDGGKYTGKLIYAASWTGAPSGLNTPEFETITWWDAVDVIGVDALFPLSNGLADLSLDTLQRAWHGQGEQLALDGDAANIVGRLQKVADNAKRQIVFTRAGYESFQGSNASPLATDISAQSANDLTEQTNDMHSLVQTFNGLSWWAGVFWYADRPVPFNADAEAKTSSWVGKPAGDFLKSTYQDHPISCDCR